MDHVIKNLETYWNNRAKEFSDTPQAVEWGSKKSQETRFKVLTDCIKETEYFSVTDVGCGTGELLSFLQKRYERKLDYYIGIDISPEMLIMAKNKFPNVTFIEMDVTEKLLPVTDYCFLSGLFNKRIYEDEKRQYLWATAIIANMWNSCKHVVAFNMLSAFSILKVKSSFAYKPCKVIKYCLSLTPHVVLRYDYMPHDFTIYMQGGAD